MVAPTLSYEDWLASQYGTTDPAQVAAAAPPSTGYDPAPTYSPEQYQAKQAATPTPGATTVAPTPTPTPTPAAPPQTVQGGAYAGMTPSQADTAYQQNVGFHSAPFAIASEAERQRQADPIRQQAVAAETETLRQQDTASGLGQPSQAYEASLTQRAEKAVREREAQNAQPWQEKIIPSAIRNLPGTGVLGSIKEGAGAAKDALGGVGPIGAVGTGLEAAATGVIKAAQIPGQRVNEVQITRAYDAIKYGDPNKTFGAALPSRVLGEGFNVVEGLAERGPGEYESLQHWLENPANADLIVSLFEGGYGGEQGYGAVYRYANDQLGMGGFVQDVLRDPFVYGELGAGAAVSTATRMGTLPGRAGRVGQAAATGLDVADALVFDPLRAPGLGVRAVDAVLPGANIGGRLTAARTAAGDRLLTAAGRRNRELNQVEDLAGNLDRAAAPTSVREPWLFERDAAGRIRLSTMGLHTRPLVRDLDTGAIRPVRVGDMERAMEIARRLPHERELRLTPGARTSYQRMLDDWMGMSRAVGYAPTGLPREVDKLYPSRGVAYRRGVEMDAYRIKHYGQEAIDGIYQTARDAAAKGNPVRAALVADRMEAAIRIAGATDASAKVRRKEIARIRTDARKTGKYRKDAAYQAMIASNAKAPAGGTPSRLTWNDVVDVVDDDTRAFAETALNDRRVVGDVVIELSQNARRLQDLAKQAVDGTPLTAWDQAELDSLLKSYGAEFPSLKTKPTEVLQEIAGWRDFQRQQFVAGNARRQIGQDKGYLDKAGNVVPTGVAARDDVLGKAVRALDTASATYRKYQLYNPLNILRYSGLQAAGNAVTLAVGDLGALPDYAAAIGARARNRGRATLDSPADSMMQATGVGRSPFLKQGIKDDLRNADFGDGPVTSVLKAGRTFAGAFDLSLREAAYMHRFKPRYRALQMGVRDDAVRRAAAMGVPVNPVRVQEAIRSLDALGNPYRAWDASQLKTALLDAARDPGMAPLGAGARTAAENWADRVARDYANGVRTLHKDAIANVNRLGFSFDETKLDAVASKLFMYHYWSSRANLLYTREMLGNPALLNGYVSLWRTLDREAEKSDAPPWLRGFYGFMETPMGLTVFGNPTALLNTFAIFNPEVLGEGYDGNLTGLGKARKRSPFFVNPVVDQLLLSAGVYGAGAQSVNLNPVSTAKLYDWINHWNANAENPAFVDGEGNPVPPPIQLRTMGGRAVSQIVAEKVSELVAPALNRIGVPADVMQFGDEASSQQQDLKLLMLDVLAEQNPGLGQDALNDLLVDEHAGGFDTADPVYQLALDRYAERAFAGILEGRDVPDAARGLIDAASPFPRIPQVTARLQNDAIVDGYFAANEDAETRKEIINGILDEPIRIGGYEVAPPSLFTTVELGGRLITPEQLGAMSDEERLEVADAWFAGRNPDYEPGAEIPFPDAAWRTQQVSRAADPADLALQEAQDRFFNPGTPEQNAAAKTASGIAKGQLPEGTGSIAVTIDGREQTFDAADLAKMTADERSDLRWLWVNQSGNQQAIDDYYAAKDALIADEPDLGGWSAMGDLAGSYPGGALAWVEEAVKENPTTYGAYADRLDPVRYPPGSPDWVEEMLSLEAYQTLTEQRHAANAPVAWGDAPGAPVIPGLSGAANLNDLYLKQQEEVEEYKPKGQVVAESMQTRFGPMKTFTEEWAVANGYDPGATWGLIIDQTVNGHVKGRNTLPPGLYDELEVQFSGETDDGKTYGPIPSGDSWDRQYIIWALSQPEGQRDPLAWGSETALVEEFDKGLEQGYTTDETGAVVLDEPPEDAAAATAADPLSGYGVARAADGSGVSLTTTTPAAPSEPASYTVGGLGGTLYQDASTTSQPLLALRAGTPMTTLQTNGDWVMAEHPTGLSGWVRRSSLSSGQAAQAGVTPAEAAPTPAPEPPVPDFVSQPVAPVAAQPQPGVMDRIGGAVGGFLGGIGSAIGGMMGGGGHNGQGNAAPPSKPAVTSQAAPKAAPADAVADPNQAAAREANAATLRATPPPKTTPFYDVVPASDGIGVQSTIASDRTWMEQMLDNHAVVTVDFKAPAPVVNGVPVDYSYQVGHGAAGNNHAAYDISCDDGNCAGRPVKSPVAGTVVCAGYGAGTGGSVAGCTYSANTTSPNNDGSAPAHTVVIEVGRDAAGNPVQLAFNHVGAANLQPGQRINVGDPLGTMGNTPGGPHIHLEAWVGDPNTGYQIVDPQLVVGGHFTGGATPSTAPALPAAVPGKVAPRTTPGLTPGDPAPYQPLVQQAATANGVPPGILSALIQQESQYDPAALSPAGALGIAQFMPDTAAGMGIDPLDPNQAIDGAARYLAQQYAAFGSWELALAAYNAGPGNVQTYGGIPPFPETQHYVQTILANA